MPGSMPYSLEKGPYLSVIEDYVNGDRGRALETLATLRNGGAIDEIDAFDSQPLDAGPYSTSQLRDHFKRDWLGYKQDGQGNWQPPAPFDNVASPTTGFWQAWHGDCEGVLRLTLIRALEVSLGIPHTQAPAANPTQHWPIELFWRCPVPWFEGWVTWRANGSGPGGQVTVLLTTPSHGHPLKNSPLRSKTPPDPDYQENPPAAVGPQGSWVVSQGYHRPRVTVVSLPATAEIPWTFPTLALAYKSEGPPVTVSPAEWEGGVLNPPTPWVPHVV